MKKTFEDDDNVAKLASFVMGILFLTVLLAIVFVSNYLVQKYIPGFWQEYAGLVVTTIVALIIAFYKEDDEMYLLRGLLIIGAFVFLISKNLVSTPCMQQEKTLPLIIISFCIIGFSALVFSGAVVSYFKNDTRDAIVMLFSKIIAITEIAWLLWILCNFFGTQYIWIAGSTMVAVLAIYFTVDDTGYKINEFFIKETATILFFSPLGICLISTIIQFWNSSIVWGFSLGEILIGLIVLVFLFFIGFGITKLVKYKKQKSKAKKEAREITEKKENDALEIKNRLESAKKRLTDPNAKEFLLEDILLVIKENNQSIERFSWMSDILYRVDLTTLVTISDIKSHIVWNNDFIVILQVINDFVENTFEDNLLKKYLNQMDLFLLKVENHKRYNGYKALIDRLNDKCFIIFEKTGYVR